MTYKVFLVNLVPATPHKELLAEIPDYDDALKFGLKHASGYCQGKERPMIFEKISGGTLIDTPTDWAIYIREA